MRVCVCVCVRACTHVHAYACMCALVHAESGEEVRGGQRRKEPSPGESNSVLPRLLSVSRPRASGSQVEVGQESEHPREDSHRD